MRVSSRATVIYRNWSIEPNEIKEIPKEYEKELKIRLLIEKGFIWPVDNFGSKLDAVAVPERLTEPEPTKEIESNNLFWEFAQDYLERNTKTVVKNLQRDKLTHAQIASLLMVERNKLRPRKPVMLQLEKLEKKYTD